MKKALLSLAAFTLMCLGFSAVGQSVGINTTGAAPNASAIPDVQSTSKEMLVPRMATTQRPSIASQATGLLLFDNTTGITFNERVNMLRKKFYTLTSQNTPEKLWQGCTTIGRCRSDFPFLFIQLSYPSHPFYSQHLEYKVYHRSPDTDNN